VTCGGQPGSWTVCDRSPFLGRSRRRDSNQPFAKCGFLDLQHARLDCETEEGWLAAPNKVHPGGCPPVAVPVP
jgi:hypothetical protein